MKKTIKEMLIVIGCICFLYVFSWLLFILFNEIVFEHGSKGSFISGIIILIIGVILYFDFERRVIKKNKFNSKAFLISFILTWQIFLILFWWQIELLAAFLHKIFSHSGFDMLCGLEYGVFLIEMQIQFVAIFLIKGIMLIYKKVKSRKENNKIKV